MQLLLRDKLRNHKMRKEWKMCFVHLYLNLANQEVLGLMVMTWITLRRQVVQMERLLVTLPMQNKALHSKSFIEFSDPNTSADNKNSPVKSFIT